MARKRTATSLQDSTDPFAPGVYLTDGSSLFNIVGELPHEPSLRLVEDCSTLEILMVHIDGLRAPGVRRIVADHDDDEVVVVFDDDEAGAGEALSASTRRATAASKAPH